MCTFDCVYCECGFNADHRPHSPRPTREEVATSLEQTLIKMAEEGQVPDVLTFAAHRSPPLCRDYRRHPTSARPVCSHCQGFCAEQCHLHPSPLGKSRPDESRQQHPETRHGGHQLHPKDRPPHRQDLRRRRGDRQPTAFPGPRDHPDHVYERRGRRHRLRQHVRPICAAVASCTAPDHPA